MQIPTVCLATLVLNEMEWLPKLYRQHQEWTGLLKWVFVESADAVYAKINHDHVTDGGLSVDGTTEFLEELTRSDDRIVHIKHGISTHPDSAQGKCQARQRYLIEAEKVRPHFLMILDADEMYPLEAQAAVMRVMATSPTVNAFTFNQRNVWRPPPMADLWPLFSHEVQGGFWDIPHVRGWRWQPGLRYTRNHNTPDTSSGHRLDTSLVRLSSPQCIHMGFAASAQSRIAKHRYYQARGEGQTDARGWYVESRKAWETWRPGTVLPRNANVVPYAGPVPESFQ